MGTLSFTTNLQARGRITEAKREETRRRRVQDTLERLRG